MIRVCGSCLVVLALIATMISTAGWTAKVSAPTANTWSSVTALPLPVAWPAAASANGHLYLFAGDCVNGTREAFCMKVEAYTPKTHSWSAVGTMPAALVSARGAVPSAATGSDGRIYIIGLSVPASSAPFGSSHPIMLAYDARSGKWSHPSPPRDLGYETVLVGGVAGRIYAISDKITRNAQVSLVYAYDLRVHTWSQLRSPPALLQPGFAATAGPGGRIFVMGGGSVDNWTDRVAAYDPRLNTWSFAAPLPTPRADLQAVTGPDGRIYAIGGTGRCFTFPCNMVEAYNTKTNSWKAVAPLSHPRSGFAAARGPDGRIYVLGGGTPGAETAAPLAREVDAYTVVPANGPLPPPVPTPSPVTRTLAPMPTARQNPGAATGGDGKIYVMGGVAASSMSNPSPPGDAGDRILRTVEAYAPRTNTWTEVPPLPDTRTDFATASGPDGRIYVIGGRNAACSGSNNPPALDSVEIYNPTLRQWSAGPAMPDGRARLAAAGGRDGRIYTIGGDTGCPPGDMVARGAVRTRMTQQADPACPSPDVLRVFDPHTAMWRQLAPLGLICAPVVAAGGPDGRIFVFRTGIAQGTSAAAYDPRTNRWTAIAPMIHARMGFAAATGGDGRIYLIGGCVTTVVMKTPLTVACDINPPSPVDAYDPRTNTWSTIGETLNARQNLAAATGADGRVYAAGGSGTGAGRLLEVVVPQK